MNNQGLLVSQIGYDLRAPMRAIYRGALPEGATFTLNDERGEIVLQKPLIDWGECWMSHWWIADFSELSLAGTFTLTLSAPQTPPITCPPFRVAEYQLWNESIHTEWKPSCQQGFNAIPSGGSAARFAIVRRT